MGSEVQIMEFTEDRDLPETGRDMGAAPDQGGQGAEMETCGEEPEAGRLSPEDVERPSPGETSAGREGERMAAQARVEAEMREIHRLDPSINGLEDLMAMPNAREFYELVRRGNTFLDAYRLANFDRITAAKAEQARQQALNNARSKDHLRALGGQRGGGALAVPAEEMAMFKAINPGVTEAQIQAYYNKNRNR